MPLTKVQLADKAFVDGTVDQMIRLDDSPDTVVQRWRVGDVCFTHTSPRLVATVDEGGKPTGVTDTAAAFGVTALDPAVGWKRGVQVLGKTIVVAEVIT